MRKAFIAFIILALCGCSGEESIARAQRHARQAQAHYVAAAKTYERMLANAPDSSSLRFAQAYCI